MERHAHYMLQLQEKSGNKKSRQLIISHDFLRKEKNPASLAGAAVALGGADRLGAHRA